MRDMRKTGVSIDGDPLEQARILLGAFSLEETDDRALRQVVQAAARR